MKVAKMVLSEQIKQQLIDDIMSRRYRPGDRLLESALAQEFGVSQAPVREALKSLEEMGLVTQEPYKGTTVRAITNEDIYEAFTVRAALESIAAGLAARYSTPEDVCLLENILDEMITVAESGDAENRIRMNNEFHDEVMRMSQHKLIIKMSKNLRFASWSYVKGRLFMEADPVRMTRRHRKIIDAIARHDEAAAAEAMRKHIEENMPEINEQAERLEQPALACGDTALPQ